jgi:hypothetical protein
MLPRQLLDLSATVAAIAHGRLVYTASTGRLRLDANH